jgi:hypothetical protein
MIERGSMAERFPVCFGAVLALAAMMVASTVVACCAAIYASFGDVAIAWQIILPSVVVTAICATAAIGITVERKCRE